MGGCGRGGCAPHPPASTRDVQVGGRAVGRTCLHAPHTHTAVFAHTGINTQGRVPADPAAYTSASPPAAAGAGGPPSSRGPRQALCLQLDPPIHTSHRVITTRCHTGVPLSLLTAASHGSACFPGSPVPKCSHAGNAGRGEAQPAITAWPLVNHAPPPGHTRTHRCTATAVTTPSVAVSSWLQCCGNHTLLHKLAGMQVPLTPLKNHTHPMAYVNTACITGCAPFLKPPLLPFRCTT